LIRRYGSSFRSFLMAADALGTSAAAFFLSLFFLDGNAATAWRNALTQPVIALAVYDIVWVVVLAAHGLYRPRARFAVSTEIMAAARATIVMALITFAALYVLHLPDVSRALLGMLLATQMVIAIGLRAGLRIGLGVVRLRRGRNLRHVLVVGSGRAARDFAGQLEDHGELGLRVIGFLGDDRAELEPRWEFLGGYDKLPEILHSRVVDEVAICVPIDRLAHIDEMITLCETEGRIVRIPLIAPASAIAQRFFEELDGTVVMSLVAGPGTTTLLLVKRLIDVTLGSLALVLLAPLYAGIAAAMALTEGAPVLYRQERVGLNGRRFRVVKFRTMVRDADARLGELLARNEIQGKAFKLTDDPRVTRFGRFLRRSSLDELPQVWNVLRGDMSLVGPRPPLPREVEAYDAWHRRRLSMKPGITGLWQIAGRREPEFDKWVEMDLEYIDHWSPWLDVKIILRTVPALLRWQGR
jgi:exopolysaccharide biosynthesis polyprenyl glycosylphosphotransferase